MTIALAVAIAAACSAAKPPAEEKLETLSISAELILTTLAASAAEPLTSEQLCDRGGICGTGAKADIDELMQKGLIAPAYAGGIELTPAGASFVNRYFTITRSGDEVSFEKRDGQQ